jgi:hypothetical protein
VVVDEFSLADVAAALHHLEELNNDLAARPDQDLTRAAALCIRDRLQGVRQDPCPNHVGKAVKTAVITFCIRDDRVLTADHMKGRS